MYNEEICSQCPKFFAGKRLFQNGFTEASKETDVKYIIVSDYPRKAGKHFNLTRGVGLLLKTVLEKHGISTKNCYFTYVCKCLEGNHTNKSAMHCISYFEQELNKFPNAKKILVCGKLPTETLVLSKDREGKGVTSANGMRSKTYTGHECIITSSPSKVYYDNKAYPMFDAAVGLLTKMDDTYITPYQVISSRQELIKLKKILFSQTVACDIETTGLNFLDDRILRIGINDGFCTYILNEGALRFHKEIYQLLKSLKLVFHNGTFDTKFLKKYTGHWLPIHGDTLLMAYSMNEVFSNHEYGGYKLNRLAPLFLGVEPWKDEVQEWVKSHAWDNVPHAMLNKYLNKDCFYTFRLHELWESQVPGYYYTRLLPLVSLTRRIEYRGIEQDPEWIKNKIVSLDPEIEILRTELNAEITPHMKAALIKSSLSKTYDKISEYVKSKNEKRIKFWAARLRKESKEFQYSPDSVPQTKIVLSYILGYPVTKTDSDFLELNETNEFCKHLLEYRKLTKLRANFTKDLRWSDGRVHTSFNVHGTVGGRLSSSKPNLQQLPKAMRPQFRASDGMVLIAADYSQLEYKVGVALAEAEEVLEKIRQGVDFHQICQDAMETFLQRPVQRVDAKRVNFQGMYGVSDRSLADALGCDIYQAGFFRKKQFAFAVDFRNRVNTKIKTEGFIETPYGRRRRFALLTPESIGDALKQGFNMIVQSTAIDVCYDSMLQLEPKLEKIGGGIVLNVHDEIVAEVPEEKVDEAKELMRSIMEAQPAWSPINYTTELTVYKNWCLKKERN